MCAAAFLGALGVLGLASEPAHADECLATDLGGTADCNPSSFGQKLLLESRDVASRRASTNTALSFPSSSSAFAAEFGVESYRIEVPNGGSRVEILAYGERSDYLANVTFSINRRELEIAVITESSEWKSVTGVRDNIGYTTRFHDVSFHDKVTGQSDTFRVESRYAGEASVSGRQKMLDIGFQFNELEMFFDIDDENGAVVSETKFDLALRDMLEEHAGPAYSAQEMEMALAVLSDPAVSQYLPNKLSPLAAALSSLTPAEIRKAMALESPIKNIKGLRSELNGFMGESVSTVGDVLINCRIII